MYKNFQRRYRLVGRYCDCVNHQNKAIIFIPIAAKNHHTVNSNKNASTQQEFVTFPIFFLLKPQIMYTF